MCATAATEPVSYTHLDVYKRQEVDRMDGAQFAKMLSDKHLFELNRMEYKYSTVSVKEFAELPVSYTHLDVYKRQVYR